MQTIQNDFKEYGTMDAQGKNITPETNVVTFELKDQKNAVETILTKQGTKKYTLKNVFGDWRPEKALKRMEKESKKLKKRLL